MGKDRPKDDAPQIMQGFEFLPELLQQLGGGIGANLANIFNIPGFSVPNQGDVTAAMLQGGQSNAQAGSTGFQNGLQTGFVPQALAGLEAALLPGLMNSQARLGESISASNNAAGTMFSTGAMQDRIQGLGGLEQQHLATLGQAGTQLAGQGQQIQGQLAGLGAQLPTQLMQTILPFIQTGLNQSNMQGDRVLQALNAVSSGAGATPFYQPTYGPSKGEQFMSAGTQLGSAYLGGKGA